MVAFNVGDWVYYKNDESWLDGALGYVLKTGYYDCLVHFIQDGRGNKMTARKMVLIKDLILANDTQPLTEESFEILMDLALATRDFEWCRQLTEQYKNVTKAGV